jgi:hypothetical protein
VQGQAGSVYADEIKAQGQYPPYPQHESYPRDAKDKIGDALMGVGTQFS